MSLTVSSDVFYYWVGDQMWRQRDVYGDQLIEDTAAQYGLGVDTGFVLVLQGGADVLGDGAHEDVFGLVLAKGIVGRVAPGDDRADPAQPFGDAVDPAQASGPRGIVRHRAWGRGPGHRKGRESGGLRLGCHHRRAESGLFPGDPAEMVGDLFHRPDGIVESLERAREYAVGDREDPVALRHGMAHPSFDRDSARSPL